MTPVVVHAGTLFHATDAAVLIREVMLLDAVVKVAALSVSWPQNARVVVPEDVSSTVNST